jgi:hypothetical protein
MEMPGEVAADTGHQHHQSNKTHTQKFCTRHVYTDAIVVTEVFFLAVLRLGDKNY